ncbi:uncharacterized protein LOC120334250 [Styela clava]|uniref:uncharacterized protein LOC120334250 n=1 Tax=Styela clava TaxID=7725 RepID=UPI00193A9C1B|nr:uncharacterized protein LOC120334250 [Styela clava]
MACQVSPRMQTGTSVYKNDFKKRITSSPLPTRPQNRLRKNRPHPNKDFLLPSQINDGIELQKRVRRAVREYLDEIYYREGDSNSYSQAPPQFIPPKNDEDLRPREILMPKTSNKLYRSYSHYQDSSPNFQVTGKTTSFAARERPSTAVAIERSPPGYLQAESKRDRSVRIRQEVEDKHRIQTASPQPKKWQRISSAVPTQKKSLWTNPTHTKRALSAPPTQGYSYYKQSTGNNNTKAMYKPVQDKLSAWAETANDYEKQVVYNLLNKAAKPNEGPPTTPPSPQEAYHLLMRAKSVPAHQQIPQDEKIAPWSPYFNNLRRQQNKQRNLNSAPVKKLYGLVPNATQYPPRDQRIYRLPGQDMRVPGNPADEKELKEYLSKIAKVTQKQWRQPEKKYLIAPMHSYPNTQGTKDKDYKCDVSFFQSVRAPFKSHFIIHPDFTSENFIQKKRADQMVSHIRY